MKKYSPEEVKKTLEGLPQPLKDFAGSETLTNIYVGIQEKHHLNLRQLAALADATNMSLLGLEPESALETNLHQLMHELPNAVTKELVADINDRVFKEARRRLTENILEPSTRGAGDQESNLSAEDQEEARRRELIMTMREDDPEYIAALKHDEEAQKKKEEAYQAELAAARKQKTSAGGSVGNLATTRREIGTTKEADSEKLSLLPADNAVVKKSEPIPSQSEVKSSEMKVNIKLQQTVTTKPEEVVIAEPPPKPSSGSAQPTPTADPYRETIE